MKIDIIICAYNAHKYIDIALNSVVTQSIKEQIQVTIVNDGSVKDYCDIVDKYRDMLKINIINLRKNHGLGYAKQVGLSKTNNEYFMFLDSDDRFKEDNSVEKLYKEVQNNTSLKLVCGMIELNGKVTHSQIFLHGKLFKRSHIVKYKIKNKNLYIYEDLCFLNAYECLLEENEKRNISDVIYCYNQGLSSESITSTKKETIKIMKSLIYSYEYGYRLAKKYKKEFLIRKKIVYFFYLMYSRYAYRKKKPFKNEEEYTLYLKYCAFFYHKHKGDLDRYVSYDDKENWYDFFIQKLEKI